MVWLFPALILSVVLNVFQFFHASPPSPGVKVIGVIDGDTVVLEGKVRVRLRYVDAPEKGRCGYEQATKELERLAMEKNVRIEETIPDQYGRGMALVYNGKMLINEKMVASGWVRYHHDITDVTERIKSADDAARAEKLGIYGACQSMENTKNPKCNIKGNIDKFTDTRIYHMPGCAQYKTAIVEEDIGESWFCTEVEAKKAGYVKSKTCP